MSDSLQEYIVKIVGQKEMRRNATGRTVINMENKFQRGTIVKVIKLYTWDDWIQPEIKLGWVGQIFGTNDNEPDKVVVNFGGKLYTLFTEQLEETSYTL